jgi:hypothetical protein
MGLGGTLRHPREIPFTVRKARKLHETPPITCTTVILPYIFAKVKKIPCKNFQKESFKKNI